MNKQTSQNGFILLAVLVTTIFIMMLGVVSLQLITSNLRTAKIEKFRIDSQFAADAGIDDAVRHLNQDQSWVGSGSEVTLLTTGEFKTTYQTVITEGSTSLQKFIDVTARTYAPSTALTPTSIRKFQVEMRGVASGSYSIVTGVGGLNMLNNSKILGGEVFINGELHMSNSAQIGLSFLPVKVSVADQSCPLAGGPTFPQVCTTAERATPPTQPITATGSSRIYGEVQATNQTTGDEVFMFNPGLVSGSPAAAQLPDYDRQTQINQVAHTRTGSDAGCSLGTKTWLANTKIVGDVTISGTCVVTVEGNIWITGNLTLRNAAVLVVKLGVSSPPVIMVDGSTGVRLRNAGSLMPNLDLSPKGFRIITFASNVACSVATLNACDVTGTNLYSSKDITTISIENSASAGQTEFYARWSKVNINNAGNIGALVGQTVEMSNSAAITFGTSVSGFSGPVAWVVKSYKRTF